MAKKEVKQSPEKQDASPAPRPLQEIQQDYTNTCAELGDIVSKINNLNSRISDLQAKINKLHVEANKAEELEKAKGAK